MSHVLSQDLHQKLESFFSKQKDVLGVWLYGSRMTGTQHAKSDWDLAVLFSSRDQSLDRLARLEDLKAEVATTLHVLDSDVQMVDIEQAPIPLAFEIVQSNELLKGEDRDEVIFFEQKIFSMYEIDYYHHYKTYS